ncbi:hypothetical protein BJ508DRAFT_411689 [Ascobolus immersus RN42]|uniref:Uncharacterized protein n=1 Tax=Ascobolus immersus RN42 TaxID=1160509 RepID=A0A3N4IHQ2_ASCIM|nr:hypothetical protein BJ508DRAFT_411689 [Ascobolus immersus RN42]
MPRIARLPEAARRVRCVEKPQQDSTELFCADLYGLRRATLVLHVSSFFPLFMFGIESTFMTGFYVASGRLF